jgi:multiple sugar transport system ATP-binding protein
MKDLAGKTIVLGIRPEQISRAQTSMNGANIQAVVEIVEPVGAETFLYFSRGKQSLVARMTAGEQAKVNDKLTLTFDLAGAKFFDPVTGKTILQR